MEGSESDAGLTWTPPSDIKRGAPGGVLSDDYHGAADARILQHVGEGGGGGDDDDAFVKLSPEAAAEEEDFVVRSLLPRPCCDANLP